ncbi:MAG TPA: hypothetical protein VF821_06230 [Lentzea sp.]
MNRSLILVSAAAALALSACSSTPHSSSAPVLTPSSSPTSASTPSASPPTSPQAPTQAQNTPPNAQAVTKTDNRIGYGALKLGMTLEEARAAGLTDLNWDNEAEPGCTADGKIAVSKKYGIERITLPSEAKTSKGIGVGSTFGDVRKAYPAASEYRSGWSVSIDGNAHYAFVGEPGSDANKVVKIKIGAHDVDCSMAYL